MCSLLILLFTQTCWHVCLQLIKLIAESLCTCPITTDAHCRCCHSHKYVHTYIYDTSDSSPRHFSPAIHLHILTFDSSTHTNTFTHISATQQTHHREPVYLPNMYICSNWFFGPHVNIHIYVYSSSSSSPRFFSPVTERCVDTCVDMWVYIYAWIYNYRYVHGYASIEICVSMSV